MRRYLVYIIGLFLAASVTPFTASDVGKLSPVEAVAIYHEGGALVVETDTGEQGRGADLPSALEDLQNTAPGHIFLDTAEYLLLAPDVLELMDQLPGHFRPSCGVCQAEKLSDLAEAAVYLDAHGKLATLAEHRAEILPIPHLREKEERMYLE